jgi:uncharacterized membrane protein
MLIESANLWLLFWAGLSFWTLGQIWFGQIVIYPLFAKVGEQEYASYHRFYSRRIPLPVIVPGFASFLAPLGLAFVGPTVPLWMNAANIVLGILGLLITVALMIPRHALLEKFGKNDVLIRELINFNWPRTLTMTLQAAVTLCMLAHVMASA